MWDSVKLGDVCDFQGGSQPPKKEFVYEEQKGYVRFIQIRDFKSDKNLTYIPISKKNRLCNANDIFIGRYGASVGQILQGLEGAYNVALMKTIPNEEVISKGWLFAYLNSPLFQKPLIEVSTRSAQNGFSKEDISTFELPLPPRAEQERIVAKLDSAFDEIDVAIEAAIKNIKSIKVLFDTELAAQFKNLKNTSKIIPIADACEDIFAGGDAPKDAFSKFKTDEFNIPIFANAAKHKGLYGFTDTPRVHVPAVTIAGRGSGTGYTEIRLEPFLPIFRLIVLLPNPTVVSIEYLKKAILSLDLLSSGSAIPQLTVPMIKSYKIPIPTLEEQRNLIEKLNEIELKVSLLAQNYTKKIASHNLLKSSILSQELKSSEAA